MQSDSHHYGTGRRKSAVARVFVRPGQGTVVVNGRQMDEYFPTLMQRVAVRKPLELTQTTASVDVVVTVVGGGVNAQAGAVRHGLSRALIRLDGGYRAILKKNGLLTRDAREVERKIYGQPGSRKRFQFSKR